MYLFVEGPTDVSFFKQLIKDSVPQIRQRETVEDLITTFINAIITLPNQGRIGIVIDADNDAKAAYANILRELKRKDIDNLPTDLPKEGYVGKILLNDNEKEITLGVFILPNNQDIGSLETLLCSLIDEMKGDKIKPKTDAFVQGMIDDGCMKYDTKLENKVSKSKLYTWLAFQKDPGSGINTALQAKYIHLDSHLLEGLKAFLQNLYSPTDAPH